MAKDRRARAQRLTRGALAARTGVNLETIRYYERMVSRKAPGMAPLQVITVPQSAP